VKLDCGILDSSLWIERDVRDVFITALLLAKPQQFDAALPQIHIRSLKPTGWKVPPGEYGFVRAASTGIIDRAKVPTAAGLKALEVLGSPEMESRSPEFDGRRVVRIAGGFVVLNYMRYRDKDTTGAERQARFRERLAMANRNGHNAVTTPLVTQADADVDPKEQDLATKLDHATREISVYTGSGIATKRAPDLFTQFWAIYPKHEREVEAELAFDSVNPTEHLLARMISTLAWQVKTPEWLEQNGRYIPRAASWLRESRWNDEPTRTNGALKPANTKTGRSVEAARRVAAKLNGR
jgi:hypothetical protein